MRIRHGPYSLKSFRSTVAGACGLLGIRSKLCKSLLAAELPRQVPSGSGLSAVAAPGCSAESQLTYDSKAEANEETANQMAHQSPSDDSATIISAAPGARAVSRSDWPGREIAS
jgi:hypothetical protein